MRISLNPTIRFEVFKRDMFTCQYCGGKVPTTVLEVDHIDPVSKGGTNEIFNLVTSCKNCNRGKSARKLSDNTVVEKQRKQLELIQEKREQIELMFQWKESLKALEKETVEKIKDYINAKIKPFGLTEGMEDKLRIFLQKNTINEILEAIDISAQRYLRFSRDGEVSKEDAENFLDKIGGILVNRKLTPIQQKLSYVKGILKNNCMYLNVRTASILLNQYTNSLREYWSYSDDDILLDIEEKLIPETRECQSWTQWRILIEGWIDNIQTSEQ